MGISSYNPESQVDDLPPVATEEGFALDGFMSAKLKNPLRYSIYASMIRCYRMLPLTPTVLVFSWI